MIFRPGMIWCRYRLLFGEKWHWEVPEGLDSKSWSPDISKWSKGAVMLMTRNINNGGQK